MIAGVDLSVLWAAIFALCAVMYVLLDGFNIGVGVLSALVRGERRRTAMLGGLVPLWDGNETWLLLGGVSLFAAFPRAFGALLPAFYVPLMVMVLAVVLRAAALGFRAHSAGVGRRLWDVCFAAASIVAAFAQGLMLGAYVAGIEIVPGPGGAPVFAGGALDWLSPFSVLAGAAAVFGYALLGAGWLVIRTTGEFQVWSRATAQRVANVAILLILAMAAATALAQPGVAMRWNSGAVGFGFAVLLLFVLFVWGGLVWAIRYGPDFLPFVLTTVLFLLLFSGLLASLFPFVVPLRVTLWAAAAAADAQFFLLVGATAVIPLMVFHTVVVYASVRGKIREDEDG